MGPPAFRTPGRTPSHTPGRTPGRTPGATPAAYSTARGGSSYPYGVRFIIIVF